MDGPELGRQLRARRTAAGRTVASVAADAGLSVPYIANLENGRGNPTLATLQAWAGALGARLEVGLRPDGTPPQDSPTMELTPALRQFSRSRRFRDETDLLARGAGIEPAVMRGRLLHALAAVAATSQRDLNELDWHRILDAIALIHRDAARVVHM